MRLVPLRPKAGFTLIELLVSIVILGIMLLTFASVTALVARTWHSNLALIDNFTKARTILSLLDRDIQCMVMRPDVAAFVDQNGHSQCAFYTRIPGNQKTPDAQTRRTVSLVQYLLSTSAVPPVLQREDYGNNFSGVAVKLSTATPQELTDLQYVDSTTQTETISSGVLMFQFQFVDGTGSILTPNYTPTSGSPVTTTTPFYFDYTHPGASYNPRIVVISMLVLNDSAYGLANKTNTLSALLNLFPAANLPVNETYSKYWNGIINTAGFGANLPAPLRSGVRVFERHIPLPITTPSS